MKKQKTKISLFHSAKARLVIAVVAVIGVASAGVYTWQASVKRNALQSTGSVISVPQIESVPGAGNPSMEYVKQQDIENVQKAEQARAQGTSAVPTINRGSFVGSIDTFGQQSSAQCPLDPSSLPAPDPESCTVDSLQRARESGVRALELRCKGCTCPSLKTAGYTLGDLREAGMNAKILRDCGFGLNELKAAGFSAADLKAAGFTVAELKSAGFSAAELKDAGFSAADLKAAGFSADELKAAGFSAADLKDAGFTPAELAAGGYAVVEPARETNPACNPADLKKARDAGVSAQALKAKGCGVAALKAAGYTAAELRSAGFSAKELKDAGFSPKELKDAGFSARDLKGAGFNAAELKSAGFTAADLKDAGFSVKALKDAGFSGKDLKDAGFSAADLKDAGFTASQLKDAGFSAKDLRDAGFSASDLKDAGFSAEQLKAAGFSAADLTAAGYTKGDLLRAGFTPSESGFTTPAPAPLTVNPQTAASAFVPKIKTNSPSDQLAELERLQQQRLSIQQRQDMVMQQQGSMAMQAQKLMVGWSNYNAQDRQAAVPDTNSAAGAVGPAGSGDLMTGGEVVKAGDIMFAVLETSINTDEKDTPVMARIVGGPYKGGKLIGRFSLADKRVFLTFNLLNLPDRGKSVAINSVAIDPDTARTALSGEVNNHYLLKYGTLFASSFLEGMGKAVSSSGSTVETTPVGTVVVQPDLNATQSAVVALGQVGTAFGKVVGQNANIPPTVQVASGTGMGLLFMSDVTIPPATK